MKLKCFVRRNEAFLWSRMELASTYPMPARKTFLQDRLPCRKEFVFDGNEVCSTVLLKALDFRMDLQSTMKSQVPTTDM